MNTPHFEVRQTQEGWQVTFAFQASHRPATEWLEMRWGFNAGALLDEALDRYKLFIETQSLNETAFLERDQPDRILALRGMNLPGKGLQMALIGKASSADRSQALQAAKDYAREIFSIFPQDFILRPAEEKEEYDRLSGKDFFAKQPLTASIQRSAAFIPPLQHQYFFGLWQASSRAHEQVWRALSNMPQAAMLNILIQPSMLYEGEREMLLRAKKLPEDSKQNEDESDEFAEEESDLEKEKKKLEEEKKKLKEENFSGYVTWAEAYVKRRLIAWKKFFLMQVHVLVDGVVDESLLRSIGSAFTRDANDLPMPGFQAMRPNSADEEKVWREHIRLLDFVPGTAHLNDLADVDEVFAVFRFPYRPETSLPGASFFSAVREPPKNPSG